MTARTITDGERRARLARRHCLATETVADEVVDAADAVIGYHSSDPASVFLAAHARTAGARVEDVEAALYESRSLVRVLGMRRTMFVVPAGTVPLLQHGCAAPRAAAERRRLVGMIENAGLADNGTDFLAGVELSTLAALDARGEAVAAELKEDVPELGLRIGFGEGKKWGGEFGLSTRVLFLLATQGRIVRRRPRGSWTSSQYRWAPLRGVRDVDAAEARAGLTRLWLRAFGPGAFDDLEWWSGWTVAQTRTALASVGAVEVEISSGKGFVLADDLDVDSSVEPWAALLPALDSTVMGWKERDWYLGGHRADLFDRNGNAGPTVWWNGRIVGGWGQSRHGEIVHRLLEDVGRDAEAAIEARCEALADFVGDTKITPRFRTPVERKLVHAADGP